MRRWPLFAFLAACSGHDAEPGHDALDFVSPEAALVAQVHAPSLLGSALVRKRLSANPAGRQLNELVAVCGYDPVPRVERVTVAMLPQGAMRGEFAAVVEGRLDATRLAACAHRLAERRGERLVATTWSGSQVLRRPGGSGAIAFVNDRPGTVLVGESFLVRSMLRRARKGGRSIRADSDVTDLLSTLGAERPVRIVVRPTPALRDEARRRLIPSLAPLADATAIGLGVSVGARLDVTLLARARDAAKARRLTSVLESAVARAEREPLLDLTSLGGPLRSFAVETRDRDVIAVLSVTEAQLDAIARDLEPR